MERLRGLDAGFLYLETPTLLMHTLKLVLLDPPAEPIDVRARLILETRGRLSKLRPLRCRLLDVPFGLHHPLWIETEVDLEWHIRRVTIGAPGGDQEMDEAIAEIASCPLDRSRPLWELWVLEGREDGAIAMLLKIHHALADGTAAAHLIAAVTSVSRRESSAHEAPHERDRAERVPSNLALVLQAVGDRVTDLAALPALVLRTVKSAARVKAIELKSRPPRVIIDAPRTSFNGALTRRRALATASISLSRALAVKAAADVTLNDVVLALVSSALRTYLGDRGELPNRSLIASLPASSESEGSPRLMGNRVSSMFASLATNMSDPWERLQTIHAGTLQAKMVRETVGPGLLAEWLQYAMPKPFSWAISEWSKHRLANWVPPPINIIVSNVHGPGSELFAGGLALRAIYSVGPILEGVGVNITVWSYLDRLHFTVLACRDMMPAPHLIADHLETALGELEAASLRRSSLGFREADFWPQK